MDTLPEIVVLGRGEDPAHIKRIQRQVDAGQLRKIYSGVYTSNLASPIESIVKRNWQSIVGYLLPGAVVSFKSAKAAQPEDGRIYVTYKSKRRTIALPGLAVDVIPGHEAITEGPYPDMPFKGLFLASEPRWLLENLAVGKGVAGRVITRDALEAHLDKILQLRGESSLNELRDTSRRRAVALGMAKEFDRLDKIIGALLGTRSPKKLHGRQGLARAAGSPYDPARIDIFDALFSHLKTDVMPIINDVAADGHALENFAFFEAYFSNYIEGTIFLVSEAEQIVFEGKMIANRVQDSHDILGTFNAALQRPWRNEPARTEKDFIKWLKAVNGLVMKSRPEKHPGLWKLTENQAGNTLFVHPDLVPGTLSEGFARINALDDPFARALMTMFVITEVHPFTDGNGRTARLAMNAELSAGNLSRIIIPTLYREDYLLPLKALSTQRDPIPYVLAMTRAQKWTGAFNYDQLRPDLENEFKECNAFEEDLRQFQLAFPATRVKSPR